MNSLSEFKGKYILQGTIVSKTGLHIGGSDEGIEIGGVDNPVIKDPITGQPYIPGSALKGKLRSALEWSLGLIAPHPKHKTFSAYDCGELSKERAQAPDPQRWDKAYRLARLFGHVVQNGWVQTGRMVGEQRDALAAQRAQPFQVLGAVLHAGDAVVP